MTRVHCFLLPLLFVCTSVSAQNHPITKYGLKTVWSMDEYHRMVAQDPSQEIVALDKFIPGIRLDIRYATTNNLMKQPMYSLAAAFLRKPAAEALKAVQEELKPLGYGIKVYDGYRPYRVTVRFYEAYHDTAFVASPYRGSRHNRGCAIDMTLIDLKTGEELYMPTPYDAFTPQAAATYAKLPAKAIANRKIMQDAMLRHGFVLYPDEWWHFDYAGYQKYPVMDLSYEQLLGRPESAPAGGSHLRYLPDWESLKSYTIPEWYRDAKFGIFIHWGVYSVPEFGSEWYPRNMYLQDTKDSSEKAIFDHHVATYGEQDRFGYKDLIPKFKAERWNPEQWAELFKESGAKYVVPVAEHHDGFAMYKSSLTRWNAAEMGPKRDIVGELFEAVRKKGLIPGLSFHRIEHWWFMNGGRTFNSDVNDEVYKDFYGPAMQETDTMTTEYMNDWLLRCNELVDQYHPQLFWFDWWIGKQPQFQSYLKSFASYYYNQGLQWKKGVVINYKYNSYPPGTAVLDLERGMLAGIRDTAWQTDDAVGFQSWGYIKGEKYKSPQYLIDELVDIVSKNGNLLLNIGPRADGIIPQEQQTLLLAIGKWLKVNSSAIYGTRPWSVYGEGPTSNASGPFADDKIKPFTAQDIRFTTHHDTLYAITLKIPDADIIIRSLSSESLSGMGTDHSTSASPAGSTSGIPASKSIGSIPGHTKIKSVSLVGSNEKLHWSQTKEGLTIRKPAICPSNYAAAFRILLE